MIGGRTRESYSDAARRAAETRRRQREAEDAEINRARMERAGGLDTPGAKFETVQEERERRRKERRRERDRARRQAKKGASTTSAAEGAAPAVPTSDLDVLTESLGMGPAIVETDLPPERPPEKPKPVRDWSWPGGSTLSGGGELPHMAGGGDLPPKMGKFVSSSSMDDDVQYREIQRTLRRRAAEKAAREGVHEVTQDDLVEPPWWMDHMARGGELPRFASGGYFRGRPRRSASDIARDMLDWANTQSGGPNLSGAGQKESPRSYDVAEWMANNRAIDSLREALGRAGYSPQDVSRLASNKDVLGMWKVGWSLADLRRTGLIPIDPHSPEDIEVVGDDTAPTSAPIADVSIPTAPAPPIPGVRLDKRGRIITARKGSSKKNKPPVDEPVDLDEPLPLTRKRPKPFFAEGGEIPHYAVGGGGAGMAIVGDLPGQSLESIKSDPHTEVIVGNRVVSHADALRRGLFDARIPRHASGTPGAPPGWSRKGMPHVTYGTANQAAVIGMHLGVPGAGTAAHLADMVSVGQALGTGPVGAIAEVVKIATAAAIGANKAIIGGAGAAANWAASGPNVGRDIEQFGSAVSNAGESLSKLSPVAGVLVNAFGEAGKALGSFMQAVDGAINRYAEVNPEIAQQQAIGEIRQVMGDLRRGAEAAPELVRYMQTQQDLQQKFEDIKIKALNQILKTVTPILDILNKIMPEGEVIGEAVGALLSPLTVIAESVATLLNIQRDDRLPEVQDPADILLRRVGQFDNFGRDFGDLP